MTMNGFESKKIEDCFDGSRVVEYCLLEGSVGEAFIKSLKTVGDLEYFPHFPRPFYRVLSGDGLQVKGVQDEQTFQVILPGEEMENRRGQFEDKLRRILSHVDTDYDKCVGCHICQDVCPTGYIKMGLGE